MFSSNFCVYSTTRCNKCGRIGTKWLFFFTFIEECCVVIEKNIDKKLANRISYQIWYKRCLKREFGRGVQICERGFISARSGGSKSAGGSNPLWHQHATKKDQLHSLDLKIWNSANDLKCLFYNYARERLDICNFGLLDN